MARKTYPIIKTIGAMRKLLAGTDDETIILRDSGGYVWVSSGYTRQGVFLTMTPSPNDAPIAPLSLQPGDRLKGYGPFTVVYDSRNEEES